MNKISYFEQIKLLLMITVVILGIFSSAAIVSAAPGGNGNDDNKDQKGKSSEAKENKGKSSEAKENKGKSSEDNKENKGNSGNSNQGNSGTSKVTICHVPPGNPDNAHTITVGNAAVPAHLDHGDTMGPCGNGSGGGGSSNNAKLTVTKVVVNDNGGTKTVSDFPLFLDLSSVTSGVQNTVSAGPHTVSETSQTGYVGTISGDCAANGSITLNSGDVKSCTITNNDLAEGTAALTVIKVVVNGNDGTKTVSDFPLFLDLSSVTSGVQNTVSAGLHTVSETGQTGYAAIISGDCADTGSITLNSGDVKSCTITNTLTVIGLLLQLIQQLFQ